MLCLVAEGLGHSLSAVPVASSIFLVAEALLLFGSEAQKQAYLPELGSGRKIGAFAIAEAVGALRPGAIAATYSNGLLNGTKIGVSDGMIADLLLTVALDGGEPRLFLVEVNAEGVSRKAQTGVDPSHAPAIICFQQAVAQPLGPAVWSDIRRLLDRAAVLVAFEQIGVADATLEIGLEYSKQRKAFGRLTGSFQAIKHKLADVWISNQLARSNAYYAAWALQRSAEVLPLAAATARVAAGEALERAARELIQVLGGIGVTWEHDAHLYYRRGQHLSLMLGGLREWQDRVAQQLAATV
jgi:acyl-CoA dehydrogenase